MPISFIRESIEKKEITTDGALTIVQKKVELRRGSVHEILACDIYQDTIVTFGEATDVYIEAFVTPFPVIYSEMDFTVGLGRRYQITQDNMVKYPWKSISKFRSCASLIKRYYY